ncbi:MAG: hypothetical protein ACLGHY_01440, partial [Gammaproteobacteria bacterium]
MRGAGGSGLVVALGALLGAFGGFGAGAGGPFAGGFGGGPFGAGGVRGGARAGAAGGAGGAPGSGGGATFDFSNVDVGGIGGFGLDDAGNPNTGLVGPMIRFMLPLLIAVQGGRMVYGVRGAVVAAVA